MSAIKRIIQTHKKLHQRLLFSLFQMTMHSPYNMPHIHSANIPVHFTPASSSPHPHPLLMPVAFIGLLVDCVSEWPLLHRRLFVCAIATRGGGVAQLVCRASTRDPKTRGSNPVRSTRKKVVIVFPSQKCCAGSLSVCPTPVCVYTHA